MKELIDYYFDNNESASYNKSNPDAMNAMLTSQNYIEKLYGNDPELQLYVQKRKLNNYSKLLTVAGKDRSLLQFIFKNNIDKLFTPWNLLKYFHKSKAIRVSYFYLKARFYYLVSHSK